MKTINIPLLLNLSLSVFLLLGSALPAGSAERLYVDIITDETRKINVAVPWFTDKNSSRQEERGKELADTLARALTFHGIFSIIPATEYKGSQQADWKKLAADYTVLGRYTLSADAITLELHLLDVGDNEMIMAKSYSGSSGQTDEMLFAFCDDILKTLTGKPGIARSRIAFVNQQGSIKEVFLTDILGKNIRQVTRHKHLTVSPRFVPGTTLLSYSSYHTGNQNLYITDLRQSKTTRALSRRKGLNLAPAWSADGQRMIVTLSKNGSPDLFLMDNKGKIIEQLTSRSGINVSPSWSPDGKHLVFVSDRIGKPQLYLMELESRKVRRLTYDGAENAEPNWSPTEDLIVYSSLRNGVYQLFTLNPFRDDPPIQLTKDPNHHETPGWSPDGNQIIFAKRDGQKNQIYGILKDGSYQRQLFTLPGSQSYPQWAR
jgi:TolB protein